jgi:AraC family transcriptional regulator
VSRFLYFDPHLLRAASDTRASDNSLGPRLLFEDLPLWPLMMTLKGLLDEAFCVGQRYFEAIGIMLVQELVRYRDADTARYPRAARSLEPMSFLSGLKQSFGMSPHRTQIEHRIEHAKRLLAKRELSVTEIGLEIGFTRSSVFVTAFRKATGFSPSAYARSLCSSSHMRNS